MKRNAPRKVKRRANRLKAMNGKFIDTGPVKGGRISYAANDPSLSGDMPDSFSHAPPAQKHFNESSDPLAKVNREAMGKSERERREESGVPDMVKLHKPFPELKPDHETSQGIKRASFNNDWLKQQRNLRLSEFAHERDLYEARERDAVDVQRYHSTIDSHLGPSR